MDFITYELLEIGYIYLIGGSIMNHLVKKTLKSDICEKMFIESIKYVYKKINIP